MCAVIRSTLASSLLDHVRQYFVGRTHVLRQSSRKMQSYFIHPCTRFEMLGRSRSLVPSVGRRG